MHSFSWLCFSSACLYLSLPKACVPGWSRVLFVGQGRFRQLRFQQQHLSRAALCFCGSLQPSCP